MNPVDLGQPTSLMDRTSGRPHHSWPHRRGCPTSTSTPRQVEHPRGFQQACGGDWTDLSDSWLLPLQNSKVSTVSEVRTGAVKDTRRQIVSESRNTKSVRCETTRPKVAAVKND